MGKGMESCELNTAQKSAVIMSNALNAEIALNKCDGNNHI